MDDMTKIEQWRMDDGRRAERRVSDSKDEQGNTERVIEVHIEDERPLFPQQRIVEKSKPMIVERVIQTLDKSGSVVEQKTESIDPKPKMQLVDHIAVDNSAQVHAQSVQDCDCQLTREDMLEAIETAVAALKVNQEPDYKEVYRPEPTTTSPTYPRKYGSVRSMGLAEEIAATQTPAVNLNDFISKNFIYILILGELAFLYYWYYVKGQL